MELQAVGLAWDAGASLDQNGNTAQMSEAYSVALLQI